MKTLKRVNVRGYSQGKRLLGLTLISGVLGISFFGCAQTTPEANETAVTPKPTATSATPKPNSTTPTSQANQTTVTPKPSPTTPASQVNQAPQSELPKPNAAGDYQRTSHKYWQVVDPSGKGVACRMGKSSIEQIQTPGNSVVLDIASWPVIGTFKQGQSFEINLGPAGFGVLADNNKQPWIYVEKSSVQGAPSKCFVRANSSSVKPVQK
ncbi:hypothetical protein [Kamptonema sp. UHCC 0994]|uniref:hypothetical protein n=1 Tax=Kamptonema sp. UHCC 0994 TaxID=3031329 RepID=UPI0023B9C67F|nr:hypothetical protein [Kamptonema sp. UHCC 0994]MDF0554362.1 hypothetical protein [Kamptonema sp. UHCC 0994]